MAQLAVAAFDKDRNFAHESRSRSEDSALDMLLDPSHSHCPSVMIFTSLLVCMASPKST
jgi:hypothetical protein